MLHNRHCSKYNIFFIEHILGLYVPNAFFDEEYNEPLKINLHTRSRVIDKIKENLGEHIIKRFKNSIFEHLLDLIQRICKPKSITQLNLLIGVRVLKFGLREFSIIIGLNCGEVSRIDEDSIKGGGNLKKKKVF